MMDPRTGEVLAMASVPTYNPNDPGSAVESGARNRAITDTYEPGSTMKTFTIAGGARRRRGAPRRPVRLHDGAHDGGQVHHPRHPPARRR